MWKAILVFALAFVGLTASSATPRLDAHPPVAPVKQLVEAQRAGVYFGLPGWGGWACGFPPARFESWSWYWGPCDLGYWWDYPYMSTMYYHPAYVVYWILPLASSQNSSTGLPSFGYQTPLRPAITYATIEVFVPPDAEIWIDGRKTTETGTQRSFNTSALTEGQTLTVELRASWMAGEKKVEQSRTVRVQAGNQRIMNFMVDRSDTKK